MTRCEPPCLHPDHLIGANAIRNLASGSRLEPISRNTLKAWRDRDAQRSPFPEPIAVLKGSGPGGSDVEIWDRRTVNTWLNARR